MKKSAWYVVLLMVVLIVAIVVSVGSLFRDDGGDVSGGQTDGSLSNNPPVDTSAPASPGIEVILPGSSSPAPGTNTQQPGQNPGGNTGNNGNGSNTPGQNTAPSSTPAPTPTPTPTPTPAPTPTPTPVHTVSGLGSFSSSTGTGLNIKVDWKAYNAADGSVMLQIEVSASSYSFYTSALYNAIEVKVGGQTYYANSPDVSYDGDELTLTPMASFHVPASTGNVDIEVVWHYRGSYSGKELGDITASGSAWIS